MTEKEEVESYNGKIMEKIEYLYRPYGTDGIVILFTDGSKLRIESSEWLIINPDWEEKE